ncbi:hypothetical protein Golomagni_02969 [Golovinomyces magnicellulatus]|nr:hypothetical protein Golomagni_02969 [Golovinomyces magnicellulatus]
MYTKPIIVLLLTALVEARFGQEQGNGAIQKIGALGDLGDPGEAAKISGGSIGLLLAAANPCESKQLISQCKNIYLLELELEQADKMVAELGDSERVIDAARGLVAAEINFNPFVTSVPSICADPSLPKTEALRGVIPLIDPAVVGNDVENKNSAESVKTPFEAKGLSQAEVAVAHGFSNFTAVKRDGTKVDATSLNGAKTNSEANSNSEDKKTNNKEDDKKDGNDSGNSSAASSKNDKKDGNDSGNSSAASSNDDKKDGNDSGNSSATSSKNDKKDGNNDGKSIQDADKSQAIDDPKIGTFDGFKPSSKEGLDFGKCVPTMKFEPGLNGRKETEFTFQAADPFLNKGQQEALNPNIITNFIKNQLTNVCEANQAAKDAAVKAMGTISALNKKDASVAEEWNSLLGFAGADLNPDKAPKAGLVGHS